MADFESESHRTTAAFVGTHLHNYVGVADAKAGAVAGGSAALLLFLANLYSGDAHPPPAILLVAGGSLVLALLTALASVYPRRPSSGRSLVFWHDIAEAHPSAGSYRSAFIARTHTELDSDLIEQNFWLARVLRTKFALVRASLWLLSIGVATTTATVGLA